MHPQQMGKKLGITSLFSRETTTSSSSFPTSLWSWPSCKQPRTLSFRADKCGDDDVFKTVNSVYFDSTESWFTNTSEESESLTTSEEEEEKGDEVVIRGLRSDRLFFEPGRDTSPKLAEEAKRNECPFEESTVMAMESDDPYRDFRASMEEMVEAHGGMKEWEYLEELLVWYLRVNGKKNHGFIVGAFVDLVVGLAGVPISPASPSSSSSIFFEIEEVKDGDDEDSGSC